VIATLVRATPPTDTGILVMLDSSYIGDGFGDGQGYGSGCGEGPSNGPANGDCDYYAACYWPGTGYGYGRGGGYKLGDFGRGGGPC
jgi:hypothetical protein